MKARKGFTLIELLVVIAIIGLLIAIILPALKAAKIQAQMVICLTNLNGLSDAWVAYTTDNEGFIVNGNVPVYQDCTDISTLTNRPPYWADPPQDADYIFTGLPDGSCGPPTWEDEKLGITRGAMYPYSSSVDIYRCPGDQGRKFSQDPDNFNYRSYCITDAMNGWNPRDDSRYVNKVTDIVNPGNKFVFIETFDSRGWLMGGWNMDPEAGASDGFAIWHRKRSGFGFADGHAEMHTWTDPVILDAAEQGREWIPNHNMDSDDYKYLVHGYLPGRSSADP